MLRFDANDAAFRPTPFLPYIPLSLALSYTSSASRSLFPAIVLGMMRILCSFAQASTMLAMSLLVIPASIRSAIV